MPSGDLPTRITTMTKRHKSHKHRIITRSQTTTNSFIDDLHSNTTPTTIGSNSKLPNLLSKSSVFPSASESAQLRRGRQQQRDSLAPSMSKIERQSTSLVTQTRLPIIYTITNTGDQRRGTEYQRRQIYALNHLMREFEQERFRTFCQTNDIGGESSNEIVLNNDKTKAGDTKEQSST